MEESGPAYSSQSFSFSFRGRYFFREVLEVFVGQGLRFALESAREHPVDFHLPGRFLDPLNS